MTPDTEFLCQCAGLTLLFTGYVHLCRWVRRRRPGSPADRIRAAVADEESPK